MPRGSWKEKRPSVNDLTDVVTEDTLPFLRKAGAVETPDVSKFQVNVSTLEHYQHLFHQPYPEKTLVLLDEVGRWEAGGKGWHDSIRYMPAQPEVVQLWVVRMEFVELVKEKFGLEDVEVIRVEEGKVEEVSERIENIWHGVYPEKSFCP